MGRKFISVLGTSLYDECTYSNGKEKITTRFIQEAELNMYMKNLSKDDKIIIFLTEDARKNNWRDREISSSTIETISSNLKHKNYEENYIKTILEILSNSSKFEDKIIETTMIGLDKILHEKYGEAQIKDIDIEDGKSEDEILKVFKVIYDAIEEGDEIIFDITHGFRSIPMLALTVLNYTKALKGITINGIYYGAYEARNKENIVPIFDLTSHNDILEWTNAINTFLNYGNGFAIKNLYKQLNNRKVKLNDFALDKSKLKEFVENVESFTECIATSRGKIVPDNEKIKENKKKKKSVYDAANAINKTFIELNQEDKELVKPLIPLFNKVNENIVEFLEKDNLSIGIATIKWCVKYGLVQQGYTALEESIKTYICIKYGLEDSDKTNREYIAKAALNILNINKTKKLENIRFIPEDSLKKLNLSEENFNRLNCIIRTIPEDIIYLASVSDKRNDINHFGFRKISNGYDILTRDLDKKFKQFEKIVEDYRDVDFTKR